MERLPIEITHMVFANLKGRPRGIARLRLVCKTFAAIGLHYLVPELHLIFISGSFERLREISERPIISQHVETLFYEADTLTSYETMRQWKNSIVVPPWLESIPGDQLDPPSATASEREHRAYMRNIQKLRAGPRYTQSEKHLKLVYETYRNYLSDQAKLRACDYNAEVIREAMARMPNLKEIALSMEYCLYEGRSGVLERAFANVYQSAFGDDGQSESCGVPQMRSLLLGASHAGLKLEVLRCGIVHWEIFRQDTEVFAQMRNAVRNLKTLQLHITTRISDEELAYEDGDDYHSQIPACAEYLKESGRMRELVTAAPNLRSLDITFDCQYPYPPAGLKESVGGLTWHSLKNVGFGIVETTEDELMDYYTRHASTLEAVRLDTIKLTKGSWPRLFQRMRKALSLTEALICGHVTSDNPFEEFNFHLPVLGDVVEKYLIAGGDGPLLDLDAFLGDTDSELEPV